ncbi:hypothetical protein SAMN04487819_112122 [Actinopolyspora alba]|uniref:Uncharacterized protein n=1 Tax=Actinopolyspora alba TaxID=673379 RepID=A0A1I2A4N1_9ACTN|nr:hypothetical protein SAMN04487819_112122 [Actinopolyspora alba]
MLKVVSAHHTAKIRGEVQTFVLVDRMSAVRNGMFAHRFYGERRGVPMVSFDTCFEGDKSCLFVAVLVDDLSGLPSDA